MLVCAFNCLPNEGYSNLLILAAFSNSSFSVTTSLIKTHIYHHFLVTKLKFN